MRSLVMGIPAVFITGFNEPSELVVEKRRKDADLKPDLAKAASRGRRSGGGGAISALCVFDGRGAGKSDSV